jgi:hypothetical protein
MALFCYVCDHCGRGTKKILTPEESKLEYNCPHDGAKLTRQYQAPTSHVLETIDSGLQTKRVEQFADSPELLQEREANQRKDKNKNEL